RGRRLLRLHDLWRGRRGVRGAVAVVGRASYTQRPPLGPSLHGTAPVPASSPTSSESVNGGSRVRSPPRSRSTGADNAITRTVPSPASLSLSERRWWPRLLPGEGDAEAPSWGTSVSSERAMVVPRRAAARNPAGRGRSRTSAGLTQARTGTLQPADLEPARRPGGGRALQAAGRELDAHRRATAGADHGQAVERARRDAEPAAVHQLQLEPDVRQRRIGRAERRVRRRHRDVLPVATEEAARLAAGEPECEREGRAT